MLSEEITIIVPCYNEAEVVSSCAAALDEFIHNQCIRRAKVCFVNDGSTDSTLQEIDAACVKYRDFEYISYTPNKGLSFALKTGFEHAATPLVGYIDVDLQTYPEDFNLLLEHIAHYDMVTGFRAHRRDTLAKRVQSRIANRVRRLFTDDGAIDTGCPLKVFKREAAVAMPYFNGYHRFFPALIRLRGEYGQVSVRHRERSAGRSKFSAFNRLSSIMDCFRYLKLRRK